MRSRDLIEDFSKNDIRKLYLGDPRYNTNYDVNDDGKIDLKDYYFACARLGARAKDAMCNTELCPFHVMETAFHEEVSMCPRSPFQVSKNARVSWCLNGLQRLLIRVAGKG
jgi:hypothetical protein